MKDYSIEQKKRLRDQIIAIQEASGLSANNFATTRLGFSNGSKFSHVRNNWDQAGMVGNDTWDIIERYIERSQNYKFVATENLKKIWNICERAHLLKKAIPAIGNGGYGKTSSLELYLQYNQKNKRFKVILFDASETKTQKQLIVGLLEALDAYEPGTISTQIRKLREAAHRRGDFLLCIDEASSLKDHNIVIIKDVADALSGICGIVITGTPYFINNLNNGAVRNRHLFSETRDRLFMIPELLEQPTDEEALKIFNANGITENDQLDVVMGRRKEFFSHSWLVKKTFRGISDCIDMVRMAELPEFNFDNIEL